jgi:ligand-binding sensor domain-containing protein/signal transduction histidine kinase
MRIVAAMVFLGLAGVVHAQSAPQPPSTIVRDRTLRLWGVDEGLPNNALTSVIQTRDGYLWVGSWAGVVRFDGVRFAPVAQDLPNVHVRVLFEDRDGSVWIGTVGGGLARWRAGRIQMFTVADGLADNEIGAIAQDRHGHLWVTTGLGISRFADGRLTTWRHTDSALTDGIVGLAVDTDGQIVIATTRQLCHITSERVRCAPSALPRSTSAFLIDRSGVRWAGTSDGRVFRMSRAGPSAGSCAEGCVVGEPVTSLSEGHTGSIWIGLGRRGIARLHDGVVTHYGPAEGFPAFPLTGLAEDAEGSLWAAMDIGGLAQLRTTRVTMLTSADGLPAQAATSVAEDAKGTIWAGSRCGPVATLTAGRFVPQFVDRLASQCVLSVLSARDGTVWLGTESAGVFTWDGQRLRQLGARDGLTEVHAPTLFEDSKGVIWIGTATYVHRYEHGVLSRPFGVADGLTGGAVVSFAEDRRGRIWIGSNGNGLSLYENGTFRSMAGLVTLPTAHISALIVDSRDHLWIGTADHGVFRYRNGAIDAFGLEQGLNDRLIALMIEDASGNIWVSTTKGILKLDRARVEEVAAGRATRLDPIVIDRSDGLRHLEGMGGGFDPSGLRTRDGHLWFSTLDGFAVIDPATFPINAVPPPVVIERASIDEKTQALAPDGALVVAAGAQSLEVAYTAFSFMVPSRVTFRYRLVGADSFWHDAGTRRSAFYSHVPPGDYTFEVMAANNDGVWSTAPATMRVIVLPFVWERRGVQAAGLVVLLLATGFGANGLAKRRARHRLRELEREQALTRERTRIARDLHDDLGARLAQIALIAEGSEHTQSLNRISTTARGAMQTMDELVWAVNAKNDTVESLAEYVAEFAEEHLTLAGLRLRLQIAPDLGGHELHADTRRHLFLAFKEAVHNIVKHAQATEVRVGLTIDAGMVVLTVSDDGRGLPEAAQKGLGNGLGNMRARMESAGGSASAESTPGQGTRITLRAPVGSAPT